jgi:hypothetical protein
MINQHQSDKVTEKPCTYAVSLELTTKSNDPGPRGTYAKDSIAPVCPIRKHLGVIYRTAFKDYKDKFVYQFYTL